MPADYGDLEDIFYEFAPDDNPYAAEMIQVYIDSGSPQEDPEADMDLFYQFMNAFWPDVEPQSRQFWTDIRQAYYDLSGTTEELINWEMWRIAIGYGNQ